MRLDPDSVSRKEADKTRIAHRKMFGGHDKGRTRRLRNGQYLADILFPVFEPKRVLDVGCGLGFFLSAMSERGAHVTGVDNEWVKDLNTEIPPEQYRFHDLNTPLTSNDRFDLVASFEVAEHLEPSRSEDFVRELCALGDVVAFSAAVPGQGGSGHINLRWQRYWAELFAAQGYSCFDLIRPRIAARKNAFFWFRQNAFVYIRDGQNIPDEVKFSAIDPKATTTLTRDFHKRRLQQARNRIVELEKQLAALKSTNHLTSLTDLT